MKSIQGNIVDVVNRKLFKGTVYFDTHIRKIVADDSLNVENYILPGFVDAHVHIESSMCTPFEYSKEALKHGTIAAISDPHEIANVCGVEGVKFMIRNAHDTPMKLFFGAPSCVPATQFETSGHVISAKDIDNFFSTGKCSHLSEMMNFPGVINHDTQVFEKITIAKKFNKVIDGHAPLLGGKDLEKYIQAGITTDHECTSIDEAIEKINLGMKIMLRKSSASNDFKNLIDLIKLYPDQIMFCTDDCHPDSLIDGYINKMVSEAVQKGFYIFDVLQAATLNCIKHFSIDLGLLQVCDKADFIVVDSLKNFNVQSACINGEYVFANDEIKFKQTESSVTNQYYENYIDTEKIQVPTNGQYLNVIEVIDNSLLTNKIQIDIDVTKEYIESDTQQDILKLVVLNRYKKAEPSVAFIKGFGLKSGAIAGTIAHDSHNILAVGVRDEDIVNAIQQIHQHKGALVVVNESATYVLPLPVAGLMSLNTCTEVAAKYKELTAQARVLGCKLQAPFMTLAFMSLLVIPQLKLSDKGLFDVNAFDFIKLQE